MQASFIHIEGDIGSSSLRKAHRASTLMRMILINGVNLEGLDEARTDDTCYSTNEAVNPVEPCAASVTWRCRFCQFDPIPAFCNVMLTAGNFSQETRSVGCYHNAVFAATCVTDPKVDV